MVALSVVRRDSGCLKCPVRATGLCAPLPPEQVRFLEHVSSGFHVYPAGTDLFLQGGSCSSFFVVTEGWAFTYVLLENGARQILDFALPGAFLGFQADPNLPMTYSAECLTAVRACIAPKSAVYPLLRREARFALQLCEVEACQQGRANDHLANIGQRDALARVAHLLVELFLRAHDRMPAKAGDTSAFPLRLNHISDALGITREHASRTLRTLREQGICEMRQRTLRILDPASLLRLSGFEHDPTQLPSTQRQA
jgi:CRP/FNR family transcriptional regulator